MKNLSEVTFEDARAILSKAYGRFFQTGKWILSDETEDLGEPCKKLYCSRKVFMFWFFDDEISVDVLDKEINWDSTVYDVKLSCYIEAYKLGYDIKKIDELIRETLGLHDVKTDSFGL